MNLTKPPGGRIWNANILSRKVQAFCELRLADLLVPLELVRLQSYLMQLIEFRRYPPRKLRGLDWVAISRISGIPEVALNGVREAVFPAFAAIERALAAAGAHEREPLICPRPASTKGAPADGSRYHDDGLRQWQRAIPAKPERKKPEAGREPIELTPEALFSDKWEDPFSFSDALSMHIKRHGESYLRLHKAIIRPGESLDRKTIPTWVLGTRVPRRLESLEMLRRIECRYRLPEGYFHAKLPHQSRAASGYDTNDIARSERRRLAWHLPEDFNTLPLAKREEIIEWVRRVIITGSTDYRRFQSKAIKHRYAIHFPGIAYGRLQSSTANCFNDGNDELGESVESDPDLLPGVIDAPRPLAMEMAALILFKTSTLTAAGFQRSGVWGEETTGQKIEHLGLMFGALTASPKGAVRGYGVPVQQLTFGLLIFPAVWDWYLQWRERRRGFYTVWEIDMLRTALALTRRDTGWLRQHRELARRLRPISGLVSLSDIERAHADWDGSCEAFFKHATTRVKEIQHVARVHRDPFEPIMPILEAASPVGEYRKITEEVLRRMPDERRHPQAAAETVRAFLMLRLGLHLGLRQKNLRQLMVCPHGQMPRTERQLTDMKRGEIRWSERDGGWEVLIPAAAFKNANSSYFGGKPFRLVLRDLHGLYHFLEAYIERHRRTLLGRVKDPGTFFVKTVKVTSKDASYDQNTFYEAWRLTIQRYGVYNPYTGKGAIPGLLPHGPHNVRDVLATHILKQTGSYEQASYAIQDTPDIVAKHYGRFLPQDKAELAAKILNQVWEDA